MTGDVSALASGGCHIFSGCGFPAPGLQDFEWKPFFTIGSFSFTKPMLLAILAALVVIVFFWAAFRKPKLVPRGVQNLGEMAILAVRDQILRPSLGRKGDSYLPFLVSLFFFIYIINLMELIPVFGSDEIADVTGAGDTVIAVFTLVNSLVQIITTNEMRGRVMSVYNFAFRGGMPMGNLAAGRLVELFSAAGAD